MASSSFIRLHTAPSIFDNCKRHEVLPWTRDTLTHTHTKYTKLNWSELVHLAIKRQRIVSSGVRCRFTAECWLQLMLIDGNETARKMFKCFVHCRSAFFSPIWHLAAVMYCCDSMHAQCIAALVHTPRDSPKPWSHTHTKKKQCKTKIYEPTDSGHRSSPIQVCQDENRRKKRE